MFGLIPEAIMLLYAFTAVIILILMITHLRIHPFLALIITSGFLGLISGMPLPQIVKSFQEMLALPSNEIVGASDKKILGICVDR
jgi:GntP family gluconate:H+ symporter